MSFTFNAIKQNHYSKLAHFFPNSLSLSQHQHKQLEIKSSKLVDPFNMTVGIESPIVKLFNITKNAVNLRCVVCTLNSLDFTSDETKTTTKTYNYKKKKKTQTYVMAYI